MVQQALVLHEEDYTQQEIGERIGRGVDQVHRYLNRQWREERGLGGLAPVVLRRLEANIIFGLAELGAGQGFKSLKAWLTPAASRSE